MIGKPTRAFFERVLASLREDLGGDASAGDGSRDDWNGVVIIGDDAQADLGEGAIELGLWRVLGRTFLRFRKPLVSQNLGSENWEVST